MALRTNDGTGRLKVSDGDLLPINNSETFPDGVLANSNRGLTDPATLFATGDVRANENIGLTAMHTVFVREHNRLADAISAANPELSGEAVYQRARKLVAAQIQHITYSEYLPLLIGDNTIADYAGYDDQVDPSVSHLFSAAAFRMGHTQSFDEFLLIDENGQALPSVSLNQSTFNPGLVQEQGIDAILRGLFAQTSEAIDTKVLDQLRNTLFGPPGAGGIDLAAVDIQRGRDVGLPDYNQARIDFGLAPVTSFAEITSDTDLQAQLEQVYGTVDDIDAIVGGLAEDAVAGSMVGEFFQKVIADQFARLRDGDRFWYENAQFTTEELSLIRGTSLSTLLERNTEMSGLADNLFSTGRDPAALSAGGTVAAQTVTEYATLDGSNNNLANPTLGTPGTHLRVDYTQEYGDGIRTLAGEDRANVREISNTIFAQDGSIPDETGATGFMLAWSQFMGHDMTFAPAGAADTLKVYGTEYESATGEEFPFVAEKLNLVLGHEVYAGVNNVIERPIYLPALAIDDNVQTTDATGDITVTNANLGAQVFVEANSLTDNRGNEFTGQLTITEVPPELTPAALPENLFPDMVVTIQPGEMVFDTPAQLTLANTAGVEAGTQMDLWSINPTTGDFEIVGVGRVSADGERIETIDGGIRNSSWHFFGTRPFDWNLDFFDSTCDPCSQRKGLTSEVEMSTGGMVETHNLPTYQSLGETRGVQLVYDSLRADARPILNINAPSISSTFLRDIMRLTAKVKIFSDGIEYYLPGSPNPDPSLGTAASNAIGKHYWRFPDKNEPTNAKLQADLRQFDTGIYSFDMEVGVEATFLRTIRTSVRQSDGSTKIVFRQIERTVGTVGSSNNSAEDGSHRLVHVNTVDSALGSGWGIAGVQKLVEGYDGSILLVDGDGSELLFGAPAGDGESYVSPVGHFSALSKTEDGTFQIVDKHQTVRKFDEKNRLVSVVDRNGNTTQHVYDNERLVKIIDPALLETLFSYGADGKVAAVIDPAGRTTRLVYDNAGNLTQVLDPDSSKRTFEYDKGHRMTAEVDKNNRREEATYDFAGRVTSATRKDGSTLEVNPLETQGLYRPQVTATKDTVAVTTAQNQVDTSTYVDGNGKEQTSLLDGAGQVISTSDEIGQVSGLVSRNQDNLVVQTTDTRGTATNYEYDSAGNVVSISDSLSFESGSQNSSGQSEDSRLLSVDALLDVNGDGLDDLIAESEDTFYITFSNGDRSFSETEAYSPLEDIRDFLTGDVDKDGDVDIVLLDRYQTATLLNDGSGSFDVVESSDVELLHSRKHLVDVDNDQMLDIVSATGWLKGNGNGSFDPQRRDLFEYSNTDFRSPIFSPFIDNYPNDVIDDFDGDGDLDVALLNYEGYDDSSQEILSVNIFTNTGNGNWWTNPNENIRFASALPIDEDTFRRVDIDGDGDSDLVAFDLEGNGHLLTNNGNGVFGLAADSQSFFETKVVSGDDYYENPLRISAVETGEVLFTGEISSSDSEEVQIYSTFLGSSLIHYADTEIDEILVADDLDSDGDIDFIASGGGYGSEGLLVIENQGSAGWETVHAFDISDVYIETIKVADFNKDGFKDILSLDEKNGVWINSGDNRFYNVIPIDISSYDGFLSSASVELYDINTDNELDIIFEDYSNSQTSAFLGNGDGTFSALKIVDEAGDDGILMGYLDANSFPDLIQFDRDENRNPVTTIKYNISAVSESDVPAVTLQRTGLGKKTFAYDQTFNQLTDTVDEVGQRTLFEIDEQTGNRLSMTQVIGALDSESGETDDLITYYTYEANGLVDTTIDPLNRTTDYDYDSLGRLSQVIYARGTAYEATEQFGYDSAGNLNRFVDANGHTTTYTYDELNRIVETVEADPDGASGSSTSPTTFLAYDAAGNLASVTDAAGNTTLYGYDERGRVIQLTNAEGNTTRYGYDGTGNLTSEIDPLGREIQHRYDARNRRIETTDAEGNTTRFSYDLENNLIEVVDPLGNTTTYTYDARNRLVAETDALGNVMQYQYDAVNSLVGIRDKRGNTTRYVYDDVNRLAAVVDSLDSSQQFSYDRVGNLIESRDELGNLTSFTYDARDRLLKTVDALGGTASYTYDSVGNQLSATDQLGRTTTYTYDALNRRSSFASPLLQETTYDYDVIGNLIKVTDPLGQTTSYGYDALNRQVDTTDAAGGTSTYQYDAVSNLTAYTDELGRTTTYQYDNRNLRTQVEDPLGHITSTEYDAGGNITSVTDALDKETRYVYDELYRQEKVVDALGKETVMTYDADGNLLSLTDASGNQTRYSYDALNRLGTERIEVDGEGLFRSYQYDAVGNLLAKEDRNGRIQTFSYDALNRQIQESLLNEQKTSVRNIDYTYDAASQLTAVSAPDSTYAYTYDAAGRLLSTDNAGTTGVPDVLLSYGYDAVNNRTSVTDFIMGTQAGVESFTYDALDRVTRITQSGNGVADKRIDLSYNAASQMTGLSRASDLAGAQTVADTAYTYDTAGRLVNLVHEGEGNAIAGYGFAYDAANRLTQLVTPDGTSDYSYNDRDELTGGTHSYQADEAYSYDDTGNRNSAGYETGEQNRLSSDGTYTYEYDNEGNRTRRVAILTGEVTEYGWDYRNRMTSVVTKGSDGAISRLVEYTYDVYDRRIAKVVDSDGDGVGAATEERYVYDGEHIALVFDGEGNQVSRYLHGPQVDQVLAEETVAGEVRWALSDHQGSVRDLIDSDGAVLNHIVYDSYGQVTSETNPDIDFRFGYTGRERDEETGLYYYRARYFDPAPGTFVSTDPLGFGAGDSNLYRYVFNSPTNHVDPSGLRSVFTRASAVSAGTYRHRTVRADTDGVVVSEGAGTGTAVSAATQDSASPNPQGSYYTATVGVGAAQPGTYTRDQWVSPKLGVILGDNSVYAGVSGTIAFGRNKDTGEQYYEAGFGWTPNQLGAGFNGEFTEGPPITFKPIPSKKENKRGDTRGQGFAPYPAANRNPLDWEVPGGLVPGFIPEVCRPEDLTAFISLIPGALPTVVGTAAFAGAVVVVGAFGSFVGERAMSGLSSAY
ncbi:peroxidase family protein [cf. Phormidesmis sp. LEGE 11477]|uniref:peroxidase family protein n=1 Tax=cf. Phormidesmis sp. LEGE 11477 TaxID=1828680 RepID=UPI00351D3BD6